MSKKLMPKCIGHYDVGDEACDGEKDGATEDDRISCVFRDRCAALKQHCQANGFTPEQFIKIRKKDDDDGERRAYAVAKGDDEQFAQQLAKWSKRWGISAGRVTKSKPDDKKPKRDGAKKTRPRDVVDRPGPDAAIRKKAKDAVAAKATESLAEAYQMCAWFTKCLGEATGREVVERQPEASEGDLFVIDRMDKSRYAAVYCRKGKSAKVAVASIYPHTRAGTCQIRFPVEADAFDDFPLSRDKLGIATINDGKFKSRSRKLDKEGIAMAAEAVARLVKSGIIELPAE